MKVSGCAVVLFLLCLMAPVLSLLASLDPAVLIWFLLALTPGLSDHDLHPSSIQVLFGFKPPAGWFLLELWGWLYLVPVILLWTGSWCLFY